MKVKIFDNFSITSAFMWMLTVYGASSAAVIAFFPDAQQHFDQIASGFNGLYVMFAGLIGKAARWRTLANGPRGFVGFRS